MMIDDQLSLLGGPADEFFHLVRTQAALILRKQTDLSRSRTEALAARIALNSLRERQAQVAHARKLRKALGHE